MNLSATLRATATVLACLSFAVTSSAQFTSNGEDPASVKWSHVKTPNFKIIYPRGLDSLAMSYGTALERYRTAESVSSGLLPGEGYRHRTPVILHAYHGISNGSVIWAPRRLDLFTLPDFYNTLEPLDWVKSLAVHEERHLAQMQFGYKGWLKPLNWLIGQSAVGIYSALWPSNWMLEGDAVVAETALTNSGRGRSSDFLDYYMMAFDEGDWRNWYRWRYGSYRFYAPNYYALGYMTIAGNRYCFDDPGYTERYFSRIARNPFRFFNTQKTTKIASGKSFRESFDTVMTTFHRIWKNEAELRAPFTAAETVQTTGKWFTKLSDNVIGNGKIYGILSGIAESKYLVEYDIESGELKKLRPFASYAGGLRYSDGRLWWSESVPDPRWTLKMSSQIRYYDIKSGRTGKLTSSGRYFNPAISNDGEVLAALECPVNSRINITLFSIPEGKKLATRDLPDTLQATEINYFKDKLIISAISDNGTGLYSLNGDLTGEITCISAPLPIGIRNMFEADGRLYFSSDRDGTMELYSTDIESGETVQLTSLPYGGDDFCFYDNNLYFISLQKEGRLLHKASVSALKNDRVNFRDIHSYPIADKLSEQEAELAAKKGISLDNLSGPFETTFSQPKKYVKALNILRFHSWAPVYYDYNEIRNISGDESYDPGNIGATALFQNSLGTAWGAVGYAWHKDPYSYLYSNNKFRHSGHISFVYKGLYPVFELYADFNDRAAIKYGRIVTDGNESIVGTLLDKPAINGSAKVYIPFDFSSGGWSRGLIPQVSYTLDNDIFDKAIRKMHKNNAFSGMTSYSSFAGYKKGSVAYMQTLAASLRGYILRPTAQSCTYPRLGIGAEIGWNSRIMLDDIYSSSAYIYGYGYLPGFTQTQGLKLTAKYQHQFSAGNVRQNAISITPRGYANTGVDSYIRNFSENQVNFTADYCIPIWFKDISCFSPVAYIKNFEATPHFDCTMFSTGKHITDGCIFSAGASFVAKLSNILWIPFDCRAGFTVDWNGGPSFNNLKKMGYDVKGCYVGFIFNVDI